MATKKDVKDMKRTAQPFGSPASDESWDIIIPEGAESGRIPAGNEYIGKVMGFTKQKAKESGNPMFVLDATIDKGEYKGMDFKMFLPLMDAAMWKLQDTLTALGIEFTPGKKFRLEASEILGTLVRMVIADDMYETRKVSKLKGILPHPDGPGTKSTKKGPSFPGPSDDDDTDDDDTDDENGRPVTRKRKTRPEPEPEDDDDDQDDDSDDADEDEEDAEEEPVRGKKPKKGDDWEEPPASAKKKKRVVEEDDEDDDEEEDDDEDAYGKTAPRRGRGPVVKKKKAKSRL